MIIIYYVGTDCTGELEKNMIGGPSIEFCCDLLSSLVKMGCTLISVRLSLGNGDKTILPIEAFDGEPMKEALQALQPEWEEILFENK